jgi:hypothetical protein
VAMVIAFSCSSMKCGVRRGAWHKPAWRLILLPVYSLLIA